MSPGASGAARTALLGLLYAIALPLFAAVAILGVPVQFARRAFRR